MEKIENYDSHTEIDTRQGQILYESLEDQYQTDEIVDDLTKLPVLYKCLSRSSDGVHLKAKTKFVFANTESVGRAGEHLNAFSIRYLTIDPSKKPFLLYEYDANNRDGILYEIKQNHASANLAEDDFEWLDADNNKISTGMRLMRYQLDQNEKLAIKLRIDWSLNDTKYEIKLVPSEFLDTYEHHWSSTYDPAVVATTYSSERPYEQHIGHYKSNSSLSETESTQLDSTTHITKQHHSLKVDIEVSGGIDLGYYRLTCLSGKYNK